VTLRSGRSDRPGVTIPELLCTIVLIGIMAGVTVPRFDWSGMEGDAAARQIRVSLQMAQRLAVTEQANVVVGFDVPNARLRVLEDVNGNLQQDAGERVRWVPLEGQAGFAAPPTPIPGGAPGQALVNVGPGTVDGYPSLVFRRDGSASASAVVYVRSARRNLSALRAIAVTQATGRVEWWRSNAARSAWKRVSL
jgi:prepilin-type N-terminal cleavage/methylation domain-containing protein